MNESPVETKPKKLWQKTQYTNLIRYVPSGVYFARIRVRGKLVVRTLKTDVLTTAKLLLNDLEKSERQAADSSTPVLKGKVLFTHLEEKYRQRVQGNPALKPRTKAYHLERIKALYQSWPSLPKTEIRSISKSACLDWAAKFGVSASASAFNHTVAVLRKIIDLGIEIGACYNNPAAAIKCVKEKRKELTLPTLQQFKALVEYIDQSGVSHCHESANLIQFLAFGGFRKMEAANVKWSDCDFERSEITVRGDPKTGTKNSEIRNVPMIPDMRALLERIKKQNPLASNSDHVMKVVDVRKSLDKACKQLQIPRLVHHDLRHFFATKCFESSVDSPTVGRWMGHKDGGALAMRTYGHLRNEHSQAMAQKVTFSVPLKEDAKTVPKPPETAPEGEKLL